MRESALREEICRVGASLYARGYVHASAGNISVRLPDGAGYLITPTDACLGQLDPALLARVDTDGVQHSGARASKTLVLHRAIYAADPQAHCVIHTHSTHLVALTLAGVWHPDDILPPITPYFVMKVGHVPLVPYHRPGDPAVGPLVAQRIAAMQQRGTPIRAVMLDRLGPNVWHHSPAEASAVLEELEETARLWHLAPAAPVTPRPFQAQRTQVGAAGEYPPSTHPMPQFAANLTMLYPEHGFLDRFAAAAADGFTAVEYLFPYAFAATDLATQLRAHGLRQVLFNAPPGDWDAGERGIACLPGREAEFRHGFAQALDYAHALDCPRIHVMAGLLPSGHSRDSLLPVYQANLAWAAEQAAAAGRTVLIEPINTRDMPGYYLNHQAQAHSVVQAVGAPNLQVQMDLYHCQIMDGDLATQLRQYLPTGRVGHIQIAGVPDRHEPDAGEVHYPYLFTLLDRLGYTGWVGCEYRPRHGTSEGLGWMHQALQNK